MAVTFKLFICSLFLAHIRLFYEVGFSYLLEQKMLFMFIENMFYRHTTSHNHATNKKLSTVAPR